MEAPVHVRGPTTHDLKCVPPFFDDVLEGRKTFEIRKNDRDYRVGDTLILNEYQPAVLAYLGRKVTRRIIYVADLSLVGISGFVGLGIDVVCHHVPQPGGPSVICGKCRRSSNDWEGA